MALVALIADDPWLMTVLNRIEHTPKPNLLLGAVSLLLGRQPDHDLAAFYPNLTPRPRATAAIDEPFRRFVAEHEEEIVEIGRTRLTQTNECRRCVALVPGIWAGGMDRFHLVDIGTSAGLNLALDRYRYRWGEVSWGPESAVRLDTESRGVAPTPRDLEVLRRIGLDLSPVDIGDPEELAWLEALVWPEHHERRSRLKLACEIARGLDIERVAGDAVVTLGPVLDRLPAGEPVVVMSSLTLNQLPTASRQSVETTIDNARSRRPIVRVSLEIVEDGEWATLMLDRGDGLVVVGRAQPHGEWVELYALP
jgi:hypothetical protein